MIFHGILFGILNDMIQAMKNDGNNLQQNKFWLIVA